MKHTKSIIFAAATAAFALAAPMASATPVTLKYQGSNAFGPNGSQGTLTVNVNGSNKVLNGAGAFAMEQDPVGGAGNTTTRLAERFMAFCADIFTFISNPGEYRITETPFVAGLLSGQQRRDLNRLFDVFGQTQNMVDNVAITNPGSVAMQLAIWEIVYDGRADASGSYDLSSGNFQIVSGVGGTTLTQAQNLLNAIDTSTADRQWRAVYLQALPENGPTTQSLITVAAIPLPAPVLMLLAAIAGLVGVRRFRGNAAT